MTGAPPPAPAGFAAPLPLAAGEPILVRIGRAPETRTTLGAFLAEHGDGLVAADVAYIRRVLAKGNRVLVGSAGQPAVELRAAPAGDAAVAP